MYFTNFGGGQNALYTYLTAILIRICGTYNSVIIRLPALILSIIEVIICYKLAREFTGKKTSLLFMLMVTLAPWHIMKSRWGLESYLLSPLFAFSIYALVKAVKKKSLFIYFIAGALFGLTLYTYALSYIVVPVFLLLMLIYLIKNKQIKISQIIVFTIPLAILAMPLVMLLLVQRGIMEPIYSWITIPKLLENRTGEIRILNPREILDNLERSFIIDGLLYNRVAGIGPIGFIGLFTAVIGLIDIIRNRKNQEKFSLNVIMIFAFISNFILILFVKDMNINKANGIYISVIYFGAIGIKYLYKQSKILLTLTIIMYMMTLGIFIYKYYFSEADVVANLFDYDSLELMEYINNNDKYADKKIHTSAVNFIYGLYSKPISPKEFSESKVIYQGYLTGIIGYSKITSMITFDDLNEDDIYIVDYEIDARKIESKGFQRENFGKYRILYKD